MPLAKANPFEAFLKGTEHVVQLTIGGTEKLLKQSGDEIGKIFSGGTHMNDDGSPPGTPKATRPEPRGDYRGGFSRSGSSSPSSHAASCSPLPTAARPGRGQSHPTPISSSCASTRQPSPTAELEAAPAPSLPPRMKSRQWAAEPPLNLRTYEPRTYELPVELPEDGSRDGLSTRGPKSEQEHTSAAADALGPEHTSASSASSAAAVAAVEGPREVESREVAIQLATSPMIEEEEDDGDLNPDVPLRPRSAEIAALRRQPERYAEHGEQAVEASEHGGQNQASSYSVTAEHFDVRNGATLDAKEKASSYSARLDRAKRANHDRRASMEVVDLAMELERVSETRQSLIRNSQSEAVARPELRQSLIRNSQSKALEREQQLQMAQRHLEAAQSVQRRYESPTWDESAADWEFLIREGRPPISVLHTRIQAYENLSSSSPPSSPPRASPRASPRLTPRLFASPLTSIEADWEYYGQGTPVALLAQLRAKTRGALVTLVRRKLAHGWRSWEISRRLAHGWRSWEISRRLAHGWRSWVRFAVTHAAPSLRLIRKGVSFWTHRTLALGLAKWSEVRALMRAPRTARPLSKALSYFLERELARGWVGWLSRCAVLRATRRLMRVGHREFLIRNHREFQIRNHRELARGWGAWLEMTTERRIERVEAIRLLRKGEALETARPTRQVELDTALSPSRVALDALAFEEVDAPATPKLMLSLTPIVESRSLESLESLVGEDEVRARGLWEAEGALDEAKWDVRRGRGVPLLSPELRDADWDDECLALCDTLWEVESSSSSSTMSSSKPHSLLKVESSSTASSRGMNESSTSDKMSPRSPPVSMTSLPASFGSCEGLPYSQVLPLASTCSVTQNEERQWSASRSPPLLHASAHHGAASSPQNEEREWSAPRSPTRSPKRTRSAPLPPRGPPSPLPLPQPVLTRAARRHLWIAVLVTVGGGAMMMQALKFVNLAHMAQSLVSDGWAQIVPPLMSTSLFGFDLHASAHHGAASHGLIGFNQMEVEAIASGAISTRPRTISTGQRSSELAATSAPYWHLCASRSCGRPVVRRPPPPPPPQSVPSVPLPPPLLTPPPPPPPPPLLQLVCASLLLVTVVTVAAAWARMTKPSQPTGGPPTTAPHQWPYPPSAKNASPTTAPHPWPATDSTYDSNGCEDNGSDCIECDGISIADLEAEVLAAEGSSEIIRGHHTSSDVIRRHQRSSEVLAAEATAAEAVARPELPLAADEMRPEICMLAPGDASGDTPEICMLAPALVAHTLAPAPAYPPAAAPAHPPAATPAAEVPAPPQLLDTALDLALTTAPPELLRAFAVATAALSHASAGKHLFLRVAAHDPSVTALDLSHDPEIARWPLERQAAALALLQGSPHVTKLNLSGLNLTDAVAPALRAVLEAPTGRLELLSLEQNDFREAGLLELVEGLRTNTALRELRLDSQRMAMPKRLEEVLVDKFEALESAGATRLSKIGLSFREDAARRRVDAVLFRVADRMRVERALSSTCAGCSAVDSAVLGASTAIHTETRPETP